MPPMVVPMRHGRRTHKVASPVTSHIHRSEGSLQEKDGPELNADFPSRWTGAAHHRGTSVVHLASLEALTTQPRCCERCQAPSTHLACEHARIEEGVTEIVEPPRSQRWLLPPQRTSQKKVRLIRPRQSETEQGDQCNHGELPYVGVQSMSSPFP